MNRSKIRAVWLGIAFLGTTGLLLPACSSKFSTCTATRTCPLPNGGSAGDSETGASGQAGDPGESAGASAATPVGPRADLQATAQASPEVGLQTGAERPPVSPRAAKAATLAPVNPAERPARGARAVWRHSAIHPLRLTRWTAYVTPRIACWGLLARRPLARLVR